MVKIGLRPDGDITLIYPALPPRLNGCRIIGAVHVKSGFIILVLTDGPEWSRDGRARYATAHYNGGDQWNQGDYDLTFDQGLASLTERATSEEDPQD